MTNAQVNPEFFKLLDDLHVVYKDENDELLSLSKFLVNLSKVWPILTDEEKNKLNNSFI